MTVANPADNVDRINTQEPRINHVPAFPVANADFWEDEPRILTAGFCLEGIMSMPGLLSASSPSLATVSRPPLSNSRKRWYGPASPKCAPSARAGSRGRIQQLGRPTARSEPYWTQGDPLR